MAKRYFLPRRQDALLPWCSNFKFKLPNYGSTLGFSGSDLAKVVEAWTSSSTCSSNGSPPCAAFPKGRQPS
jgi:hypothetical protein